MIRYLQIVFLVSLSSAIYGQNLDTTIFINEGNIEIISCDSTNFPNYFEFQEQIDSIAKSYSNFFEGSLAIEKFQINKFHPPIRIDSNSRIVTLNNGVEKRLVPNDTIDEAGYTFEKEFKGKNLLLFRAQWGEGNNYFIFNLLTGEKTYTFGQIYFSQNDKYLVSINDDVEAGYSANGIQIFIVDKDYRFRDIFHYTPDWGPDRIKWIDDKTFIVRGYFFNVDYQNLKYCYKKVKINVR